MTIEALWQLQAARAEAAGEGPCEGCGVASFGFHCPACEWEAANETN